ncbi:MAG TPA: Holliday junction branch migration DNA helicase RuvB [Planctomycetaceae bacterium]|jgi:Holliday junction DNA helicase RuvB|nr:Holliday junction branch migration DNA helicase RuvB [Planctomycetaceae bacterium]MCH2590018.1 Holliday junction branch migration DNA helicase RuvB [Planctomycetales bacterium]GIS59270.1 MAG: Holliday junction ATP-dependent DNA helicase RuvB [Planctomycetaceae bacterium]HAA60141.1 Holliday junction branch migration DNA helicase RuvB [Planctomycetaceae bacterium]|tara:strand:- start:2408 stop:3499 length:1092 start_codon:yes stop_codon:yes gene_type:complete
MPRDPVLKGPDPGEGAPEETPVAAGPDGAFDPDDGHLDEQLRPLTLDDVVGQDKVVERLRIVLEAAKLRGDPLSHLLLDGPPGIGKTTLATVLPRELGVDVQITSGPSLSAPKDLLPYLTNAGRGSVLFIDEIHRLPPTVEEFIYPAMEDFRIDITLGEGLNARTINMQLEPFTLIGATTRSGMLTAPLRDRFVNREHLDFYDVDDVMEIIQRNARKLRAKIEDGAALAIASRSRGVPRKANNLLRWTRDFADAGRHPEITDALATEALAMLEVDELGLDSLDCKYLQILATVFGGGPAGMQAIAHSLNIAGETIEDEVEPFLLRVGFVQRTPRGRMITQAALQHMGLSLDGEPDESQGQLFD